MIFAADEQLSLVRRAASGELWSNNSPSKVFRSLWLPDAVIGSQIWPTTWQLTTFDSFPLSATLPTIRRGGGLSRQPATIWGGIDLLVNNAGVSVQGEFGDGTPEQLRRVFDVNLFAAIELSRIALPLLRESKRATIANVASILAHRAIPFNSEYCASKFALRGWSEAIRAELAQQGIHVLVVSPGTTRTEFFDNLLEKRREMPWTEAHAQSAEAVARATIRAIERRCNHTVPNLRGQILLLANRLSPRLVDWGMRKLGSK